VLQGTAIQGPATELPTLPKAPSPGEGPKAAGGSASETGTNVHDLPIPPAASKPETALAAPAAAPAAPAAAAKVPTGPVQPSMSPATALSIPPSSQEAATPQAAAEASLLRGVTASQGRDNPALPAGTRTDKSVVGVTAAGNDAPPPAQSQVPLISGLDATSKLETPKAAALPAPLPSQPMQQVEGTVRWLLKNNENSAELQLHPDSLGKVSVQLKVEGSQVHARIWASEPTTLPLLEQHRGQLEASLRQQGLSLGTFDLHQGQNAARNPMPDPSGQATAPLLEATGQQELPPPEAQHSTSSRRVEVYA